MSEISKEAFEAAEMAMEDEMERLAKEREVGDHQDPFESKVSGGALACAIAIFNGLANKQSRHHYEPHTIAEMIQAQIDAAATPVAPPAESEVEREIADIREAIKDAAAQIANGGSFGPFVSKWSVDLMERLLTLLDAERQARAEAERELRELRSERQREHDLRATLAGENDALRERCDQAEAAVNPCSDHNCVLGHPGGMGTNGGCQHLKMDRTEMRQAMMAQLREMRVLRERCAEMERRIPILRDHAGGGFSVRFGDRAFPKLFATRAKAYAWAGQYLSELNAAGQERPTDA